jgi:protein involved in polysaccharide export with SLBB domain
MNFRAVRQGCLAAAVYLFAPQVSATAQDSLPAQDSVRGGLLSPGDVIKLSVWREPEWSGDFTVSDVGVATFPRLGAVQVTTMTADSLRRFLLDSLGRFLRNPSIEVTPMRRVQVLGAVRTPGLYPVPPTVTIGDVIALAGGATPDGKPDQAILRRQGEELRVKLRGTTRLADTPIRSGDQIYVPQRSWVSRNAGLVAAGLSATTSLVIALLLSRR